MPLTVNVGLNRKASVDFQSTGASINLTAELGQELLFQPEQLQQQIQSLYAQAEQALDQQSHASRVNQAAPSRIPVQSSGFRPASESQKRAIEAICKKMGLEASEECQNYLGFSVDQLGIRTASMLIDHLKFRQKAGVQ